MVSIYSLVTFYILFSDKISNQKLFSAKPRHKGFKNKRVITIADVYIDFKSS